MEGRVEDLQGELRVRARTQMEGPSESVAQCWRRMVCASDRMQTHHPALGTPTYKCDRMVTIADDKTACYICEWVFDRLPQTDIADDTTTKDIVSLMEVEGIRSNYTPIHTLAHTTWVCCGIGCLPRGSTRRALR
jgi:hypothetical protein